jgi:hypothetical protein
MGESRPIKNRTASLDKSALTFGFDFFAAGIGCVGLIFLPVIALRLIAVGFDWHRPKGLFGRVDKFTTGHQPSTSRANHGIPGRLR